MPSGANVPVSDTGLRVRRDCDGNVAPGGFFQAICRRNPSVRASAVPGTSRCRT